MVDKKAFLFSLPRIVKKHRASLGLFLLGLLLFSGGVVLSFFKASEKTDSFQEAGMKIITPSPLPSPGRILVDISGAVVFPGVYQLPSGCRLELALQAAGGLSDQADRDYVAQNLNLASVLSDGVKVYVPQKGKSGFQQARELSAKRINVNTVSISELETLPGIGPKTAEKIINGRPYQKIEDLLSRKIVGPSVFQEIKEKVGV